MPDQFAEIKPGDRLPGLPTRPWNKLLGLVKPDLSGDPAADGRPTSGVEVLVANTTADVLDVYSIVALDVWSDYAPDPDYWRNADIFAGLTPAADSVVAVLMQGLAVGDVGRARLAGRAACRVDLKDVAHQYAVPIASSDHLESAAAGPVQILGLENDWAPGSTGVQWAVVVLLGGPGGAGFARFTLAAALGTSDASQANCAVAESWGGSSPLAPITVYNLPTHSTGVYVFSGAAGNKGIATYDPPGKKWWILQMECDASAGGGGGGCTGFTGTIGN